MAYDRNEILEAMDDDIQFMNVMICNHSNYGTFLELDEGLSLVEPMTFMDFIADGLSACDAAKAARKERIKLGLGH